MKEGMEKEKEFTIKDGVILNTLCHKQFWEQGLGSGLGQDWVLVCKRVEYNIAVPCGQHYAHLALVACPGLVASRGGRVG